MGAFCTEANQCSISTCVNDAVHCSGNLTTGQDGGAFSILKLDKQIYKNEHNNEKVI